MLAIIDGALCVILACVIAGRACCIQFDAEKPTPMIEVEAIKIGFQNLIKCINTDFCSPFSKHFCLSKQ